MKKTILYSIFAMAALLLFVQSVPLEARSRHHHSTRVQVGIGAGCCAREAHVTRRYVHTAVQPVYVVPSYPAAVYAPAYVYTAPVYVEDVYVSQPVYRPFTFGGLSLSWNFFR